MMEGELLSLSTYLIPATVVLGGLVAGLVARRTVVPLIERATAKSAWKYDDALLEAVRSPLVVWFALAGFRIALRLLPLPWSTERLLGSIILVLGILSVAWAAARFAVLAFRASAAAGALPGVSLIANVARVLIFTVGALVALQTVGVSITPIITALGVGGLAVGLALQDTLANFFAGIRILAAGRIRPGDFIKLESGDEGFVEDITWAQTTVRQLGNNVVMVPNAKLAGAITTNYHLPVAKQSVLVQVGVGYASDLELVERVTVEVARDIQREIEGAVRSHEPFTRYHTFGDSSINFSVILQAEAYTERFLMVHEFIKRLHRRYAAEGIEIPFPIRTVYLKRDGEGSA